MDDAERLLIQRDIAAIIDRGIYCPACNTILTQEHMARLNDDGESE